LILNFNSLLLPRDAVLAQYYVCYGSESICPSVTSRRCMKTAEISSQRKQRRIDSPRFSEVEDLREISVTSGGVEVGWNRRFRSVSC